MHASGDEWFKCDDSVVTVVPQEEVFMLKGGGDRDIAYLNIYRKVEVSKGDFD